MWGMFSDGITPDIAIYFPWDIWAVSWIAAALWANRTVKRAGNTRELPYRILEFGGFIVLLTFIVNPRTGHAIGSPGPNFLFQSYWVLPETIRWAMVGVAAIGFLFCWWARIHLGRFWSGWITKKEGHRIIDIGPYAIVRHPIYTGVLTAALATMLVKGTGQAMLGFAMLVVGYWMKGRLEERFLREELGPASYDAYKARTPMLVPFARV